MSYRAPVVAVVGDLLAYLVATLLGFASHRELSLADVGRMAATWIPFSTAWFGIALWLGLLDRARLAKGSSLARVVVAALLAAPLGAWLRSLWLGGEVVGIFVVVMAGITAGLLLLWRGLFGLALRRAGMRG